MERQRIELFMCKNVAAENQFLY